MNKLVALDDWAENFTDHLASESLKFLKSYNHRVANKQKKNLLKEYLSSYIKMIVSESLRKLPNVILNEEDAYTFTETNFRAIKSDIQDAVADGFQKACEAFSGVEMSYYCHITTLPEPINKEIC